MVLAGSSVAKLHLPATQLILPPSPDQSPHELQRHLVELAAEDWAAVTTEAWVRTATLRLLIASALEARLLNLRADRLAYFELARNPHHVTLGQLAALTLPHNGTAGQAFEVAVADAINHQVPEVTAAVRTALVDLGLVTFEPLRMVLLGMEKVPREHRQEFYDALRTALPPDAVLRTGGRGRPASVGTVLDRLASSSWHTLPDPTEDPAASQLARADAIVYTDEFLVPVSFKINSIHVSNTYWLDVPLWISTTTRPLPDDVSWTLERPERWRVQEGTPPGVVVQFAPGGWLALFREALDVLDAVLARINRGRAAYPPRYESYIRRLTGMRQQTVAEVTAALRDIHPGLRELMAPQIAAPAVTVEVPVLGTPELTHAWTTYAEQGNLLLGQPHLFFPLPAPEPLLTGMAAEALEIREKVLVPASRTFSARR